MSSKARSLVGSCRATHVSTADLRVTAMRRAQGQQQPQRHPCPPRAHSRIRSHRLIQINTPRPLPTDRPNNVAPLWPRPILNGVRLIRIGRALVIVRVGRANTRDGLLVMTTVVRVALGSVWVEPDAFGFVEVVAFAEGGGLEGEGHVAVQRRARELVRRRREGGAQLSLTRLQAQRRLRRSRHARASGSALRSYGQANVAPDSTHIKLRRGSRSPRPILELWTRMVFVRASTRAQPLAREPRERSTSAATGQGSFWSAALALWIRLLAGARQQVGQRYCGAIIIALAVLTLGKVPTSQAPYVYGHMPCVVAP